MSSINDYTDWCDTIKGAENDVYRIIDLGSKYIDERDDIDPYVAIKEACIGKTLQQIFVPTDLIFESGNISENGVESSCINGIIFSFGDSMVEFNFGTLCIADKCIEDFPEVPTDSDDYCFHPCYRPIEHYVALEYKGQTVIDCGYMDPDPFGFIWNQDGSMFGERIFVSLSGGKTFYLCSGECNTKISLE